MSFQYFLSKRVACAGAALLLAGLFAGCGTQAQNALKVQEDLSEAQRLVQVKPTDTEARQWADRAVAVAPQDAATYLGSDPAAGSNTLSLSIAAVFASAGDDPALADYMTQAVQKFPSDERGYEILTDVQTRLGRAANRKSIALKEIPVLIQALKKPGVQNIPLLSESLARAYWYAGDTVTATAQFKKVIAAYPSLSSYPNDFGPYNGLAYEYAETNSNLTEALPLAQKALAQAKQAGMTDEGLAAIQDTLGWVQYHQGDYTDAEQNLLQAANSLPREAELRYHLGLVYAAQGNTEAARSELRHAILLAQNYAAAQQALDTLPKSAVPKLSAPPGSQPAHPAPKAAAAASA